MMEAFKKKSFSQDEINEITQYVLSLMSKSFEEVQKLPKISWKHCKYMLLFHMLPKTELHKQFREKFIQPEIYQEQKALEWKLLGEMKRNKERVIKEHLIESYQYNDVKYQIIDHYSISSREWIDEIIQISIPYFSSQAQRDKFWYWMLISKSKTPEFFERLIKDMRVYKWNADLTSNRK